MRRRAWKPTWAVLLAVAVAAPPTASAAKRPRRRDGVAYYTWLAERWGERPEKARRLFDAAARVLVADPKAAFADLAADGEVARLCAEQGVVHLGGPMLGDVRPDGAKVWLRTLRPGKVEVVVRADGAERRFGPVQTSTATDLAAVVPVTGLKPATTYPYRVLVDGKAVDAPAHAAITTAPGPDAESVRIAFGTCPHIWGLGNRKQADLIRSRRPAALLLYGDVSVQDPGPHAGLARLGYLVREQYAAWRTLVAAVPVYAAWDDHDYWGNDVWGLPRGATAADQARTWEVFRRAWANPAYGFGEEGGRGIFHRSRIGPCDVIMLDTRYFRKRGSFLGEGQMAWLKAQLRDCKGPFIIISSGTMWSDYVSGGKDSWGKYDKAGREGLFRFIESERIAGVLLISGDRHGARVFRIPRPSGFAFYEFEPASLGGRRGPAASRPAWKDVQLYGTSGVYAFGEFTVDAAPPDPTVTFRLIRQDGEVLHKLTLTRGRLTPPADGAGPTTRPAP